MIRKSFSMRNFGLIVQPLLRHFSGSCLISCLILKPKCLISTPRIRRHTTQYAYSGATS